VALARLLVATRFPVVPGFPVVAEAGAVLGDVGHVGDVGVGVGPAPRLAY